MKNPQDQEADPLNRRLSSEAFVYGLFACLAVWLLLLLPQEVGKPVTLFGAKPDGLSPDAMPRLVLLGIALIAAIGAVFSFRAGGRQLALPNMAVLVACTASFLFAALLVPLGFVVASAMTVGLLGIYLGARHPVGLAVSGLVVPVSVYLVFTRVLHVALPSGPLGF